MRRSPIIRVGVVVLFVGVSLWCVVVLPALFSQEGNGAFLQSAPAVPVYPVGYSRPPGTPGGPPGSVPMATAPGVPMPAVPAAGVEVGGGDGLPMADEGEATPPGFSGGPEAGFGGGPPGVGAPMPGGGGRGMGSMPPGGMMMMGSGMRGGMSSMMGSSGMSKSQIEEINLARHAKALLGRYGKEQNPEVKDKIKTELRSVLHQQFRLQHQRRDGELAKVERRLADLRSRLKKRGDAQSTIVDRRLEQLVNDVDGLGWSAEEVPDNLFTEGGTGSMMMPGMGGMPGGDPMGPRGGSPVNPFDASPPPAGFAIPAPDDSLSPEEPISNVPGSGSLSPPPVGTGAPPPPSAGAPTPPVGPATTTPQAPSSGAPGGVPGLPTLPEAPGTGVPPGTAPVPGTPTSSSST